MLKEAKGKKRLKSQRNANIQQKWTKFGKKKVTKKRNVKWHVA